MDDIAIPGRYNSGVNPHMWLLGSYQTGTNANIILRIQAGDRQEIAKIV